MIENDSPENTLDNFNADGLKKLKTANFDQVNLSSDDQ
jgi:hypothetical protein